MMGRHYGESTAAMIHRLREGPATNAELCEAACEHGGAVARTMVKLASTGVVRRIDGASGRGTKAVYALTEAM